ncbi:MAG: SRPBCC domain-containing protein [Kordiimonadaceae bacterium]|nr:SRPBCC domain-containing protein [Kordiimonadaceae bacterium]
MDFNSVIGTAIREVENSERDGKPTHIVRVEYAFATTPNDLWNALTKRVRLQRWFAEVSGNLEEGGHFSVKGNASGEILTCRPPELLALTWELSGSVSWVTIKIEKAEDGTRLTLEHELPTDEKSEAHWEKYGPAATGVGWECGLLGLGTHIVNPDISLLEAAEAWAEGLQGKATLREWATAWGEADINSGAPPQAAKEAAERTAAFYTGEG